MPTPYSLITVAIFFLLLLASFGSSLGWEYFWIGAGLLTTFNVYLNYRKFNKSFLYWILPSSLLLGICALIPYLGRETAKIAFILIATLLVVTTYFIQDKFINGKKQLLLKDLSRLLHYFSAIFILAGVYGILFHMIEGTGDRLINNSIEYWGALSILFILYTLLNMSFFKLTLPLSRPRRKTILIYSMTISFVIFELAWLITFLPFRYIQSGMLVFLIYFITLEIARYRLDDSINKKNLIINSLTATIGILVLLITSKWDY